MKSIDDIARDLDELVQRHYYSEEFELIASLKAYQERLDDDEIDRLSQVVLRRLTGQGSIVEVVMCGVVDVPSCAPVLIDMLDRETETSQKTRSLIQSLSRYPRDDTYRAVERFLDSDQDMEAMSVLCSMDFLRTLPVLARWLRDERHLNSLLHILYERSRVVGLDTMISEMSRSSALRFPGRKDAFTALLNFKKGRYNPFTEAEIHRIMATLGDDTA